MSNRLLGKPLRPRVDLIERAEDYRLFLELPGSAAGDIDLEIENGVLRVTTTRREDASSRLARDPRLRTPGTIHLSVDFGDLLSGDELQAVHEQGVLLVTLPKA